MKTCLRLGLVLVLFGIPRAAWAQGSWMGDYDRLLGKYVTPAGVKYSEWKENAADLEALQKVVDGIAQEKPGGSAKDQLAFYINAYNAWILHEALEKYPTKSVKDLLYTFFTSKRIKVAGEEMSFNRLEKDILIPRFKDSRVHVALNCASRSCPPLQAETFSGDKLDTQLERLARSFVNSERGVLYNSAKKTAEISKIFDWYKQDFTADGGVLGFINKRRSPPLPNDTRIAYQDYDWTLNEAL